MQFITHQSEETYETTYTLKITQGDMEKAKLSRWDHTLFRDCNGKDATISDKLLALETLGRRIEEGSR